MKKLILAALATATLGTAVPAMAYDGPPPPPPGSWNGPRGDSRWMTPRRNEAIRRDIGSLRFAIDRAERNRTISGREAWGLRREAASIQQRYNWASRDGLNRDEVRHLAGRVNEVRMHLRMERADWDNDRW